MKTFRLASAPHLPIHNSVQKVMVQVLLALIPGVATHVFFFGVGILVQIILASFFALCFEALMLKARAVSIKPFLSDGSALVAAWLFALCIPPMTPWWVSAIGMCVAMVFAKHLYGGLGQNIFNPAMVGYVVVLICFPRELSAWIAPTDLFNSTLSLGDILSAIFFSQHADDWQSIAQATPLDTLRAMTREGQSISEIVVHPSFGDFGGKGWEWIANAYALGGLYLLWKRIITWHVPMALLGSVILLSLPFWLGDPDFHPTPLRHVFFGGTMLAAFFIATDPVSGCASARGRLIFAAGVGTLSLIIRRWGAFPDGIAFAVLLMNCAAPMIDLYTKPRIFGR